MVRVFKKGISYPSSSHGEEDYVEERKIVESVNKGRGEEQPNAPFGPVLFRAGESHDRTEVTFRKAEEKNKEKRA